jgi:hypothetical protein
MKKFLLSLFSVLAITTPVTASPAYRTTAREVGIGASSPGVFVMRVRSDSDWLKDAKLGEPYVIGYGCLAYRIVYNAAGDVSPFYGVQRVSVSATPYSDGTDLNYLQSRLVYLSDGHIEDAPNVDLNPDSSDNRDQSLAWAYGLWNERGFIENGTVRNTDLKQIAQVCVDSGITGVSNYLKNK